MSSDCQACLNVQSVCSERRCLSSPCQSCVPVSQPFIRLEAPPRNAHSRSRHMCSRRHVKPHIPVLVCSPFPVTTFTPSIFRHHNLFHFPKYLSILQQDQHHHNGAHKHREQDSLVPPSSHTITITSSHTLQVRRLPPPHRHNLRPSHQRHQPPPRHPPHRDRPQTHHPQLRHFRLLHPRRHARWVIAPLRLPSTPYNTCRLTSACTHSPDFCSTRHIGYNPAAIASRIDHAAISSIEGGTTASLTRVLVLHPIETGLAFIAFLLALGHGMIGSLAGATVAFVAWILVLISLAIDFSLFGIVRHHVNNDGSGSRASFGTGLWCLTAAFVTLGLGMVLVVFTCCAHAREKRNVRKTEREGGMGSSTAAGPRRRKRFGIF